MIELATSSKRLAATPAKDNDFFFTVSPDFYTVFFHVNRAVGLKNYAL